MKIGTQMAPAPRVDDRLGGLKHLGIEEILKEIARSMTAIARMARNPRFAVLAPRREGELPAGEIEGHVRRHTPTYSAGGLQCSVTGFGFQAGRRKRSGNMRLKSIGGVALAAVLFAGLAAAQQPTQIARTHLKVGQMAPDFTLPSDHFEPVRLSDFRGKKTVILAFYILAFTPG